MSEPRPAASAAEPYHLLGRNLAAQGQRMFRLGAVALGGLMLLLGLTADVAVAEHLYLGLAILLLAGVPFLLWLKDGGNRFPVFEAMLALTANAYALPLLTGHSHLQNYPAETVSRAASAVLVFQSAGLGAYFVTRGRPGWTRFWTESVVSPTVEQWIAYGIVLATGYQAINHFTTLVPAEMESVLRAVFYGLGILSTFIMAQRWGRDELRPSERLLFGAALLAHVLIVCTSLLLISAAMLCGLGLLGYLSGGRKIPWVGLAAFFVAFSVLHNGKTAMREKYWGEGLPPPAPSQLPGFYGEWIAHGLSTPVIGANEDSAGARLLDRTSLLHILCLVVHYTPERQPYKEGATYGYVLPQLVPRIIWPDKPRSHAATYELSVYYGLQDEDSTMRTTIAFGLLAEAYANFGLLGGALLGLGFGFTYKRLQLLSAHSPIFSLAGLLMILLTAWSLYAEHTLAVWVSSLFQALVVALGLPLALRLVIGR